MSSTNEIAPDSSPIETSSSGSATPGEQDTVLN